MALSPESEQGGRPLWTRSRARLEDKSGYLLARSSRAAIVRHAVLVVAGQAGDTAQIGFMLGGLDIGGRCVGAERWLNLLVEMMAADRVDRFVVGIGAAGSKRKTKCGGRRGRILWNA